MNVLVEFTLENSRFYDLRRWGKLDEAMKLTAEPDSVHLPFLPAHSSDGDSDQQ